MSYKVIKSREKLWNLSNQCIWPISHHIMPMVINALGGGHTHTNRHANQSNFKKPGTCGQKRLPGLKTGNTFTWTTLSMLKIYSRCLIHVIKVKYTEFHLQQFCPPNGLLACLPVCCKIRFHYDWGSSFSHNKLNCIEFTKLLFRRKFIHSAMMLTLIHY